jgi:hypothetical protein
MALVTRVHGRYEGPGHRQSLTLEDRRCTHKAVRHLPTSPVRKESFRKLYFPEIREPDAVHIHQFAGVTCMRQHQTWLSLNVGRLSRTLLLPVDRSHCRVRSVEHAGTLAGRVQQTRQRFYLKKLAFESYAVADRAAVPAINTPAAAYRILHCRKDSQDWSRRCSGFLQTHFAWLLPIKSDAVNNVLAQGSLTKWGHSDSGTQPNVGVPLDSNLGT